MPPNFSRLSIGHDQDLPTDAKEAIQEFFRTYDMESVHNSLADFLLCAFTDSQFYYSTPLARSDLIFFCDQLWFAIQAMHMLYGPRSQLKRPTHLAAKR